MAFKILKMLSLICLVICPWFNKQVSAEILQHEKAEWRLSLYTGQHSDTRFVEILRADTDFQSSYLAVAGLGREIYSFSEDLHLEGEVNIGQHWGQQTHSEINALFPLRWSRFPWDSVLDTSVAFGLGLSLATQAPPIEERADLPADPFLAYMMFEFETRLPRWPQRSIYMRIHHRSGVFDLVSDASGSNFVGLGLRAHFRP